MNRRKMNTTSVNVEMNNGAEFIEKISTVNSDDSIASGKQMNNSSETLSRLLNVPNPQGLIYPRPPDTEKRHTKGT